MSKHRCLFFCSFLGMVERGGGEVCLWNTVIGAWMSLNCYRDQYRPSWLPVWPNICEKSYLWTMHAINDNYFRRAHFRRIWKYFCWLRNWRLRKNSTIIQIMYHSLHENVLLRNIHELFTYCRNCEPCCFSPLEKHRELYVEIFVYKTRTIRRAFLLSYEK